MSRLSNRDRPSHSLRRFLSSVLLPSLGLTLAVVVLRSLGAFEEMELSAYDRFLRGRPNEGVDERLLVVGIDETDLQALSQYPLEDGTVADVLEALEQYGPRAIGLDIARDIPYGPAVGRERLAQVIETSGNIVTACVLSSETEPGNSAAPGTPDDLIGFADFPLDLDGEVRRTALVSAPSASVILDKHLCNDPNPENQVPSLGFLLTLLYLEPEGIFAELTDADQIQLGSVVLPRLTQRHGGYRRADVPDYQLMLSYRASDTVARQVTLMQVLNGEVDPSWIDDRVVLIGYTSTIAKDFLDTPYPLGSTGQPIMPGVVVHAQAVSQLLSAVLDGRPLIWSWSEPIEMLWIWGWSMLGAVLVVYVKRTGLFLLLGAIALAVCLVFPYIVFLQGGWIPVVPSAIALVVTAVAIGFIKQASEGGYTQAVYEQLRDQMKSLMMREAMESDRTQQTDYLEDLVQRARKIRQGDESGEAIQTSAVVGSGPSAQSTPSEPDAETMKALYQQIKSQVEQDLEQEQRANTRRKVAAKKKRIQDLLSRARDIRGDI